MTKMGQRWCFFNLLKNSIISFSRKYSKMKNHISNYILKKALLTGKILVLKLWAKKLKYLKKKVRLS